MKRSVSSISGFPRCSLDAPEKGKKIQKNGEKGRFRPIFRKGGQTQLKPDLLHPHLRGAQLDQCLRPWFEPLKVSPLKNTNPARQTPFFPPLLRVGSQE